MILVTERFFRGTEASSKNPDGSGLAARKNKKIACTKSQSMIYSFSQKDRIVANNICKLSLLSREGGGQRPKREVIS